MSVTPQFIGQHYRDTNTGNIWVSNSLTPGDWSLLIQDAKFGWLPTTANWTTSRGLTLHDAPPGITDLIDYTTHTLDGYEFNPWFAAGVDSLVRFYAPNLIDIDPTAVYYTLFDFQGVPQLATIEMPVFTTSGYQIVIASNPNLVNLLLPSFVNNPGYSITISSNAKLTTIDFSSWVPLNGQNYDFTANALSEATVNLLLRRAVLSAGFVSGLLDIHGGTNHAPTGQGAADKITLNARQPGLAVTN